MTENEALEYLKSSKRKSNMLGILPGSDIGNTIIKALEEVQQYRAIGTPEECQEAMKKQNVIKPIAVLGTFGGTEYECKNCGSNVPYGHEYCDWCGQKLDWSDE